MHTRYFHNVVGDQKSEKTENTENIIAGSLLESHHSLLMLNYYTRTEYIEKASGFPVLAPFVHQVPTQRCIFILCAEHISFSPKFCKPGPSVFQIAVFILRYILILV